MTTKWVRAKNGALFGVCKGLANTLDIPVGVLRVIWIASVLFMGAGLGLYLMLAVSLPREDRIAQANEPWILGVCAKLAKRGDIEVGIVRFLTISLALLSCGAVLVAYIVLYFVLDDQPAAKSASNPSTPPSIT